MNWFTNAELYRTGTYPAFDALKDIGGEIPRLERAGKYLNDQFEFKLSLATDASVFVLQARFGNAFGLIVFASAKPGPVEETIVEMRARGPAGKRLQVLQSPILPVDIKSE